MREIATRNTNATQNPSRSMALAPMGPLYVQHTTHTTRYPTRFGFTCVCKAYDTCGDCKQCVACKYKPNQIRLIDSGA